MKFVKGGIQSVAMESISSRMLMDAGMNNPDHIPTIMRLYRDYSPLNYILDLKGMKTKGISLETNNNSFTTVGSNHIKYRLAETDSRLEHFRSNSAGVTFVDTMGQATEPGKYQSIVEIYSDSNWGGFHEIIELADNETQLYILDDPEEVGDGVWKAKTRLWTNDKEAFINPELLGDGVEYSVVSNAHEQDFSERSVEKYEFKTWGDAYLTLQRQKYSWSGTAAAILKNKKKASGRWVTNNGEKAFMTEAEDKMMMRAAKQLNFYYLHGKSTVTTEGKTVVKTLKDREVMSGDGILHSNGGPVKIPFNGWDKSFLNYLINQISNYLRADAEGNTEVVMLMAPLSYMSFQNLMRTMGVTLDSNIEGSGSSKGIIDTYKYYELAGIRLIAMKEPSMIDRPGIHLPDGSKQNDWDTILLPLGQTGDGKNGVQLVQLRPSTRGTVAGIDLGGNIASSVDGSSTHVLFQNGIINQNKVYMLYKPYMG